MAVKCDLAMGGDHVALVQQESAYSDHVHPWTAVEMPVTRLRPDLGGVEDDLVRSCFAAKTEAEYWAACLVQTNSIVKGSVRMEMSSFHVDLIVQLTACSHVSPSTGH